VPNRAPKEERIISRLMPDAGRALLTGTGKDFIKRVGDEIIRDAVYGVLCGENLRMQTEFMTRSRLSQLSASLIALYVRGKLEVPGFGEGLAQLAARQLRVAKKADAAETWPAQWFIGLTGKAAQNVLKGDEAELVKYVDRYTETLDATVLHAEETFGRSQCRFGFENGKTKSDVVEMSWRDLLQLATAIGSQTLTIRGSEKSMYGKLFERLILGSVLSILGFRRVEKPAVDREGVFWLSDGSGSREADATLLYKPGHLVRFDIGFIGPGNPEISKDKLSRFSAEHNILGKRTYTKTIIVVDRLPKTAKTELAAAGIGAGIVQMGMAYWPRNLAVELSKITSVAYSIQRMGDDRIREHLRANLEKIALTEFLGGVNLEATDEGDQPA
jgi:hypothetical protein